MTWNTVKDFSTSSTRRWCRSWGVRETDKIAPLQFYLKQQRRVAGSVWSSLPSRRHVGSEWNWCWQLDVIHFGGATDFVNAVFESDSSLCARVNAERCWTAHMTTHGGLRRWWHFNITQKEECCPQSRLSLTTSPDWCLAVFILNNPSLTAASPRSGGGEQKPVGEEPIGLQSSTVDRTKRDWSCLWINSSKIIRSLGPCSCCTFRVIRSPYGSHYMTLCPRVGSLEVCGV